MVVFMLVLVGCGATPAPAASPGVGADPAAVARQIAEALRDGDTVTLGNGYDPSGAQREVFIQSIQTTLRERMKTVPQDPYDLGPLESLGEPVIDRAGATVTARVPFQHQFGQQDLVILLAETPDGWRWRELRWDVTQPKPTPTH